jgi:hypothetical protein
MRFHRLFCGARKGWQWKVIPRELKTAEAADFVQRYHQGLLGRLPRKRLESQMR